MMYGPYLISSVLGFIAQIIYFDIWFFHYCISTTTLLGWLLQIIYGDCLFYNNPSDGVYGVGYKEVRTSYRGNMVGIYYPMNKKRYIDSLPTDQNPDWLRYGYKSLEGIARGSGDYC